MSLRISIPDLPPRDAPRSDVQLDETLGRLGAPEGAPCELSCDCRIGLHCIEGTCASRD